jgi:26S proteasome regulatory subunit N1
MAQESDLSKSAADKGKGKGNAVHDGTQKDKAGQPVANGKKDDDKAECLFPSFCAACGPAGDALR